MAFDGKAYYEANRERLRAYGKAYYQAHKEELRRKRLARLEKKTLEKKRKSREYYLAHREEIRAKQWLYYHSYLSKEARGK